MSQQHPQSVLVHQPSVLIVDPHAEYPDDTSAALLSAGFQVTVVRTFDAARTRLIASQPSLLITDVCLTEYNGLHLVIRTKSANSTMGAIVTCGWHDPVLKAEAERLGATFVVKPVPTREFLAVVSRVVFATADVDVPLQPPYERRVSERRSSVATFIEDRRRADRRRRVLSISVAGGSLTVPAPLQL